MFCLTREELIFQSEISSVLKSTANGCGLKMPHPIILNVIAFEMLCPPPLELWSYIDVKIQLSNSKCKNALRTNSPELQNVISLSENAIEKCRMRVWNMELLLIMRVSYAVVQVIKSSVKGNKAKLQFGMVVHHDPLNFAGNSIARALFPMRPKSWLLPIFLNRIMDCCTSFANTQKMLQKNA